MKIPTTLKIGGHLVAVEFKKLEDDCANWDPETNTISIGEDLSASQKEASLFHEMIHVFTTTLGDTDLGHALLDSISEQFYQVLKDNEMLK